MLKAITHFDQVPLAVVIEIMEREIHKKASAPASGRMARSGEANLAVKGALNERGEALKIHSPVDIFRVDAKGVLWLESSRTIDEARERIQQLGAKTAGEYMLLNQTTGNKLMIKIENTGAGSDC